MSSLSTKSHLKGEKEKVPLRKITSQQPSKAKYNTPPQEGRKSLENIAGTHRTNNVRNSLSSSKVPVPLGSRTGGGSESNSEVMINENSNESKGNSKRTIISPLNSGDSQAHGDDKMDEHLPEKKPSKLKGDSAFQVNITENISHPGHPESLMKEVSEHTERPAQEKTEAKKMLPCKSNLKKLSQSDLHLKNPNLCSSKRKSSFRGQNTIEPKKVDPDKNIVKKFPQRDLPLNNPNLCSEKSKPSFDGQDKIKPKKVGPCKSIMKKFPQNDLHLNNSNLCSEKRKPSFDGQGKIEPKKVGPCKSILKKFSQSDLHLNNPNLYPAKIKPSFDLRRMPKEPERQTNLRKVSFKTYSASDLTKDSNDGKEPFLLTKKVGDLSVKRKSSDLWRPSGVHLTEKKPRKTVSENLKEESTAAESIHNAPQNMSEVLNVVRRKGSFYKNETNLDVLNKDNKDSSNKEDNKEANQESRLDVLMKENVPESQVHTSPVSDYIELPSGNFPNIEEIPSSKTYLLHNENKYSLSASERNVLEKEINGEIKFLTEQFAKNVRDQYDKNVNETNTNVDKLNVKDNCNVKNLENKQLLEKEMNEKIQFLTEPLMKNIRDQYDKTFDESNANLDKLNIKDNCNVKNLERKQLLEKEINEKVKFLIEQFLNQGPISIADDVDKKDHQNMGECGDCKIDEHLTNVSCTFERFDETVNESNTNVDMVNTEDNCNEKNLRRKLLLEKEINEKIKRLTTKFLENQTKRDIPDVILSKEENLKLTEMKCNEEELIVLNSISSNDINLDDSQKKSIVDSKSEIPEEFQSDLSSSNYLSNNSIHFDCDEYNNSQTDFESACPKTPTSTEEIGLTKLSRIPRPLNLKRPILKGQPNESCFERTSAGGILSVSSTPNKTVNVEENYSKTVSDENADCDRRTPMTSPRSKDLTKSRKSPFTSPEPKDLTKSRRSPFTSPASKDSTMSTRCSKIPIPLRYKSSTDAPMSSDFENNTLRKWKNGSSLTNECKYVCKMELVKEKGPSGDSLWNDDGLNNLNERSFSIEEFDSLINDKRYIENFNNSNHLDKMVLNDLQKKKQNMKEQRQKKKENKKEQRNKRDMFSPKSIENAMIYPNENDLKTLEVEKNNCDTEVAISDAEYHQFCEESEDNCNERDINNTVMIHSPMNVSDNESEENYFDAEVCKSDAGYSLRGHFKLLFLTGLILSLCAYFLKLQFDALGLEY